MSKYIFLFTTLLLLTISVTGQAGAAYQSGAGTKVTANIPSKVDIRIYGYTAPFSLVQATSIRVFAQVSSDKTGYFIIDPLPVSQEAREICLTTIDASQRYGFPLCIDLPEIDKPTEIGPLLLAPTISLSSGSLVQLSKTQAIATGQTLPDAEVQIVFFDNEGKKLSDYLIPKAYAKSVAKITTKTDQKGNYSISLPTNKVAAFRLFTKAYYKDMPTPKSQTLIFSVSSYIRWWIINVLPKIIILMLFAILAVYLVYFEKKTGKGRLLWAEVIETRLKPFGVRASLTLRRIWYDFRERLPSNRI